MQSINSNLLQKCFLCLIEKHRSDIFGSLTFCPQLATSPAGHLPFDRFHLAASTGRPVTAVSFRTTFNVPVNPTSVLTRS